MSNLVMVNIRLFKDDLQEYRQMALLEIGMAKMEEVFLPYMLDSHGHTFFERMEQRGFLLDSGKNQE